MIGKKYFNGRAFSDLGFGLLMIDLHFCFISGACSQHSIDEYYVYLADHIFYDQKIGQSDGENLIKAEPNEAPESGGHCALLIREKTLIVCHVVQTMPSFCMHKQLDYIFCVEEKMSLAKQDNLPNRFYVSPVL